MSYKVKLIFISRNNQAVPNLYYEAGIGNTSFSKGYSHSKTGESILNLMKELNEKKGVTFIFSSHDNKIIERGKRVVYLRDGEIVREEFQNDR